MSCHNFGSIEEYIPKSRRSTFLLKDSKGEGKTECRFENPDNNMSIVIQPSVISGEQNTNCDFLLLNCRKEIAYFIELKGNTELRKATEQILYSIKALKNGINKYKVINAIIVQTKVHSRTTKVRPNFYKKFELEISKLNGKFKHASQTHTEIL